MIDASMEPSNNEVRRSVRFTFVLDGFVGREDVVISAGSEQGAVALAGIVFGMSLNQILLLEQVEATEAGEDRGWPSFFLKQIACGEALKGFDGLRDLLRRQGQTHESDVTEAYRRLTGAKPVFDAAKGCWLHGDIGALRDAKWDAATALLGLLDDVAPDGPWFQGSEVSP